MILLMTGTHGSGKSTLCEQLSKDIGIPFIASRASEIQKECGITAQDDVPLKDRLVAQYKIVNSWVDQVAEASNGSAGGIFDRCPLDFAAYTIADIRRDTTPDDSNAVRDYVNHCMNLLTGHNLILLVEPLEVTIKDRGAYKGSVGNVAYSDLIHTLISGLVINGNIVAGRIQAGSIKERVDAVTRYLDSMFDAQMDQEMRESMAAGAYDPVN